MFSLKKFTNFLMLAFLILCGFANAGTLQAPSKNGDLFRPSSTLFLQTIYWDTSNKLYGSADDSIQWQASSLPRRNLPVGNLTYAVANSYARISESTYVGQCVSFVKAMTETGGIGTSSWRRGIQVSAATSANDLLYKAIATFSATATDGTKRYSAAGSDHVAIITDVVMNGNTVQSVMVAEANYASDTKIGRRSIVPKTGTIVSTSKTDLRNYYVVTY